VRELQKQTLQTIYRFGGISLLLLFLAFSTTAFSDDTRPILTDKDQLVLGLLPIVSPERLALRFGPLAEYLSRELDIKVVLETAPSYREYMKRTTGEKRYDLLFTAPHFYYLAQRNSGYRVVVRVDGAPMDAVIIAPKASQIFTLDDLRGSKLATPPSLALGTLLTRERLLAIDGGLAAKVSLVETPTHNASLQSMISGSTDAASLMTPVFNRMAPEIKDQVRVLGKTASTPHMPFSVAPWVSANQAGAFATAMVEIKNTPEGRALLKHLGWPGFVAAKPMEYDVFSSFATQINIE
jgi:phosphonate transport system substrate-binding protein